MEPPSWISHLMCFHLIPFVARSVTRIIDILQFTWYFNREVKVSWLGGSSRP